MKKFLVPAVMAISSLGFAQERIPQHDPVILYERATDASNQGDFEKTLEILSKVHKNDSLYCNTLVSRSYYLLQLEKYEETIEIANEGLSGDCVIDESSFYINKGVALMRQDENEQALEVFESGLLEYPRNYQLWFNKGHALEMLEKYPEALMAYQNSIFSQPSYAAPHYRMGVILYKQEMTAQAVLCYNTYLLLDPDGSDSFAVLKELNSLLMVANPNKADRTINLGADRKSFTELDLILNNKLALNEQYEVDTELKFPLTKQNHVLLSQLPDYKGTDGFWAEIYVPLYQWIWENGHFNDFSYTISFSIQNEDYKKVVDKKVPEIKTFIGAFGTKWLEILKNSSYRSYAQDAQKSYDFVDFYLDGAGRKSGDTYVGEWEFYYANGKPSGKGSFDQEGNRTGKWSWFYPTGELKETARYEKGKLEGENIYYFRNGKNEIICAYSNDQLNGEYRLFNEEGALLEKKYFKDGELQGPYQSYFAVGEILPEFDIPYKDGLPDSTVYEYYADGSVYTEMLFRNGKQNGPETRYNYDGSLYSKMEYKDDNPVGEFISYFANGNPLEKSRYQNGVLNGTFETFYQHDVIESRGTMEDGKLEGVYQYFDTDGKLYYEYDYKEGEIIGYRFYDKAGKVLDKGKRRGGEFFYKGYTPTGQVNTEGLYDVEGGKKGDWKFFSDNGVLTAKGNYVEDKINGPYTDYYETGEPLSEATYNMDTLTGYYVQYYQTGQMQTQGYYRDALQQGEWRNYYPDGTPQGKLFYHKGEDHGLHEFYGPDGQLVKTSTYEFGDPVTDVFYDRNQNVFETISYKAPEENEYVLLLHHFNGEVAKKVSFVNGIKHGPSIEYDDEGNLVSEGSYLNGNEHGKWTYYHKNQKPERELDYLSGQLHGKYIQYFEDGSVSNDFSYEFNEYAGTWKSFYENGNLEVSTEHRSGKEHGRKEFYDEEGHLQLVRFYNDDRLIGYSYLDENSKEKPMIPLEKETGIIRAYYDNGKLSREIEYVNGEVVGGYKTYYYSGQLQDLLPYEAGEYNGKHIAYFPDGSIEKEENFLHGNLHGTSVEYHENGKPKKEITYLNGIKHGPSVEYDQQGKVLSNKTYYNDHIYTTESI